MDRSQTVPIGAGSIFGEVGLISGRKRGATIRTAEDSVLVEISRIAALRLMATVPAARRAINHISIERQLLQVFTSGLTAEDVAEIVASAELVQVRAGEAVLNEGEEGSDIYVIRSGSMVVEKMIGGKPVFLSYLPCSTYFGEMALIDGRPRSATVRAAIKSEVIRIDGDAFRRLLDRKPDLYAKAKKDMESRQALNSFVESKKEGFSTVVDMYSSVASFLVENGIGEATDVLLIDENLCVGCDNCERACADSHEGLSRLNREAGALFQDLLTVRCRAETSAAYAADGEVAINGAFEMLGRVAMEGLMGDPQVSAYVTDMASGLDGAKLAEVLGAAAATPAAPAEPATPAPAAKPAR
jgi:CRP-like cAMP-binding protein